MIPVRSTIAGGVRRRSRPVLLDPPGAGVHRETAERSARTLGAVGFDDQVPELAEVAGQPLRHLAVHDQRPVDIVAQHQRRDLLVARHQLGRVAAPELGQRQAAPGGVEIDGQSSDLS